MRSIVTVPSELEQQLCDFDAGARADALRQLCAQESGPPAEGDNVNMHFHSFFSYNGEDYSPSRIAWEAHKAALYAAGLCDFDVLDGLEEFYAAGRCLGLRTSVSLETRVFMADYADVDISSPGEPGVTYIMGAGFGRLPAPDSEPAAGLAGYKQRAHDRNEALLARINPHVPDIAVDYEFDVLPLTPAGGATERHIVRAYVNKAKAAFADPTGTVQFWSDVLNQPFEEVLELVADEPRLEEVVRARLVKRGGLGYEQPSEATFPAATDFIEWVLSCEAVPMITWLDGTSGGEADGRKLLEDMVAMGAAALNIVPDRNWNIADPRTRDTKRANLAEIVAIADTMALPINIGTEMNKLGLPFVDDLGGEVLSQYQEPFLRGARLMVGHSLLLRYANYPYTGQAAKQDFPDARERNRFFESIGALPPLTEDRAKELEDLGPETVLSRFRDSVNA